MHRTQLLMRTPTHKSLQARLPPAHMQIPMSVLPHTIFALSPVPICVRQHVGWVIVFDGVHGSCNVPRCGHKLATMCARVRPARERPRAGAGPAVLPTCPRNHLCGHLHHPLAHRRCRHLPPQTTIAPPPPSSPPWLPTPATPRPIAVHAHFRGAVLRVTASVILSCSHLSRKQSGTEWPWRKRCSWCSSCTIRVGNVGGRLGNRCGCGCRGKHGLPRVNCTC